MFWLRTPGLCTQHAKRTPPALPVPFSWVSMARPGHTADPAGPTHQYMLGGSRDIPAINPRGSCSPKSVPSWSHLPLLLPEGGLGHGLQPRVEHITDPPSWLSRKLSSPGGEKTSSQKAFLNYQVPSRTLHKHLYLQGSGNVHWSSPSPVFATLLFTFHLSATASQMWAVERRSSATTLGSRASVCLRRVQKPQAIAEHLL